MDTTNFLPHQIRVVEEANNRFNEYEKLTAFMDSEVFSKLDGREQLLLKRQAVAMRSFIKILEERIKLFSGEELEKKLSDDYIDIFNTGNSSVFEIKEATRNLIDTIDKLVPNGRRKSKAITDIETAQMYAVKALFNGVALL